MAVTTDPQNWENIILYFTNRKSAFLSIIIFEVLLSSGGLVSHLSILILVPILSSIYLLWYFFCYRFYKKAGIVVAINPISSDAIAELDSIYNTLLFDIESLDLNFIKIHRIKKDLVEITRENVQRWIKSKNAKIIIHGGFDFSKGKKLKHIADPIFFEYSKTLTSKNKTYEESLRVHFNELFPKKEWIIDGNEIIISRKILAGKINEFSLYILGHLYALQKDYNKSALIFEKIWDYFLKRDNSNLHVNAARRLIMHAFFLSLNEQLSTIDLSIHAKNFDNKIQKLKDLIVIMEATPKNEELIDLIKLSKAQVLFLEGNHKTKESINYCLEVYKSKNLIFKEAACFSVAFLYYYSGDTRDLVNSFNYLQEALFLHKKDKKYLKKILNWYLNTNKYEMDKKYLFFPIALIYKKLGKKIKAKNNFKKFLKIYKNRPEKTFRIMNNFAINYLKNN